jgi:hypothetical protein
MILEVATPGQAPRIVNRDFTTYGDNSSYPVLACDTTHDRIVVAVFGEGTALLGAWIVRLSTGTVIRTVSHSCSWLTASSDGTMLACGVYSPAGAWMTVVQRADDGAVLGSINDVNAQGFSSDGTVIVGLAGTQGTPVLLNWRTGRRIWTAPNGPYGGYLAEPGGTRMAVGIGFIGGSDRADVYLVGLDGSAVLLPARIKAALR